MGRQGERDGKCLAVRLGQEDWVELLEKVRFSPWCSDEGVLDQAVTAFQHYGPELGRAEREARSRGALDVDVFLDALAT